ncbi:MAG: hypothetical protein IPO63_10845 [Bacteroidetes bacterium]|nr:hypothetical protein [Bacteroidota bacterium]
MKTKIFLFLFAFFCTSFTTTFAQVLRDCDVCGEYYLESIPEVASGINLKNDFTFEFFFSSGALDRTGIGTWKEELSADNKKTVVLNSDSTKKNPLSIVSSSRKKGKQTTVKIIDINPSLSSYFIAVGFIENDTVYTNCNQEGEAVLDGETFDSLQIIFEFCPDHLLSIPSTKNHNYFQIKSDESLFEIFFRDFTLSINEEGLEGNHPVIKGNYKYIKSN